MVTPRNLFSGFQLKSKWTPSGGLQVDSNSSPIGMPLRIQSRVARGVRAYPQLQAVARGLLAVASAFGKYPQLLAAARGSLRISSAAGGGGSSAAGDGLRSVENIFSCWRWPEGFVRGCPQLLAADRRGWPRIGGGQSAQPSPARPSPALAASHRLHFSCGLIFADGHTTSNAPDLFRPPKLSGVGPGQY